MDKERVGVELVAETGGFKKDIDSAGESVEILTKKVSKYQTKLQDLKIQQEALVKSIRKSYLEGLPAGANTEGALQSILGRNKDYLRITNNISKAETMLNEYKDRLSEATEEQREFNAETDKAGTKGATAFSNLGKHLDRSRRKMSKLILSLLSVRSAYSVLSRAAQSYLSADTQLSTQIKNAWFGLGAILAPVLQAIANAFTNIVTQVNAFIKALTGIDFIARANAKALNTQAKATEAVVDATTGLDELNIISKQTSGAGGGADVTQFTPSNVDTSWATKLGEKLKPVYEWIKNIATNHMPEILTIVGLIGAGIALWKLANVLGLTKGLAKNLAEGEASVNNIGAKLGLLAGTVITVYFATEFLQDWEDENYTKSFWDGIGATAGSAFTGAMIAKLFGTSVASGGLVGAIIALGAWIVYMFATKGKEIQQGFKTIWQNATEQAKVIWSNFMEYLRQTVAVKLFNKIAELKDKFRSVLGNFSIGGGSGYGSSSGGGRGGFADGGMTMDYLLKGDSEIFVIASLTRQE